MQAFVICLLQRMRGRRSGFPIGWPAVAGVSLARAVRFPIVLVCVAVILPFGICSVRAMAGAADRAARVELRELFRIDGTDDELALATIGSIAVDLAGRLYVADPRTPQVLVFDSDGRLLDRFGTEGEGPGDLDRPVLVFATDDDELGVVHFRNGRIQYLDLQGNYLREAGHGNGEALFLTSEARYAAGTLVLGETELGEAGSLWVLRLIGADGRERSRLAEQETSEAGNRRIGERVTTWVPFDVGPGGRVYAALERDRYEVRVWNGAGEPLRTIHRRYDHLAFPRAVHDRTQNVVNDMAARIPYRVDTSIPNHYRDIARLLGMDGDRVLVLDSRGARTGERGVMGRFSMFDGEGAYVRDVVLIGAGSALHDFITISRNRLFVVIGGATPPMYEYDDEPRRDIPEMTVICYLFEPGTIPR